jgi:hypothetical protein
MKPAALGIRTHSGWGALVIVSGSPDALEVVARKRVAVTDPRMNGANQPYHFAQSQKFPKAERYVADCAAISEKLAVESLREVIGDLRRREHGVVSCAILLGSGRPLPSLSEILASHSLIHAAEGEFFRRIFWKASERLGIPVIGIRERDLERSLEEAFGERAVWLRQHIAALGKSLGPPWTADQKTACLAALLALGSEPKQSRGGAPKQVGR